MSGSTSSEPEAPNDRLVVLIPVFNDWGSLELLLNNLDQVMRRTSH